MVVYACLCLTVATIREMNRSWRYDTVSNHHRDDLIMTHIRHASMVHKVLLLLLVHTSSSKSSFEGSCFSSCLSNYLNTETHEFKAHKKLIYFDLSDLFSSCSFFQYMTYSAHCLFTISVNADSVPSRTTKNLTREHMCNNWNTLLHLHTVNKSGWIIAQFAKIYQNQ